MFCPKCGKENPDGANFCGYCTEFIGIPGRCPKCAHQNNANDDYCKMCGCALPIPPMRHTVTPQAVYVQPTYTQQPPRTVTTKQLIQQNRANGQACCPRCGSTSLTGNPKGRSAVKGVVGGAVGNALLLGAGLVAGLLTSGIGRNKVLVTCMNCGKRWKP